MPDDPPRPWIAVAAETIRPVITLPDGWGPTTITLPAGTPVRLTDAQQLALTEACPGAIRWFDTRRGEHP